MKVIRRSLITTMILAAVILTAVIQQASAQSPPPLPPGLFGKPPILLGTIGACNNISPGGPCTQTSTLVLLNPQTGALIKKIGPVGFTVNGLAWDRTSGKLYASTAIGDTKFHGLITINPFTGAGKPVDPTVVNFGLALPDSPVHSITIDVFGHMVGWYDENGPSDTYVRINQHTGVATEFPNTGINTANNGVSFGEFNLLWNIDTPRFNPVTHTITQTAYILNPFNGTPFASRLLSPPTSAALGDFHPGNNLYYGLNFDNEISPPRPTSIVTVDVLAGTITPLGPTVDDLHTITFVP